jgi:hypothetical protein
VGGGAGGYVPPPKFGILAKITITITSLQILHFDLKADLIAAL